MDGQTRTVTSIGTPSETSWRAKDIELGEHDQVLPGLDEKVEDGSAISVASAARSKLSVDGERPTYWVTSTDVDSALAQIGRRSPAPTSRPAAAPTSTAAGMSLTVVTPKTLTVKVGSGKTDQEEGRRADRAATSSRKLNVDFDKRRHRQAVAEEHGRRGRQDRRHQDRAS